MSQISALISGTNQNYDYQLTALERSILNPGVLSGLGVTSGTVAIGEAFILCTRTNGQQVMLHYTNTASVAITTSGTTKVWIGVSQGVIDDGSANAIDGTGIATIQTGASYPSGNYIPLASIVSGTITDARSFVSMKALLSMGYATGFMKEIDPTTGNEVLRALTSGSSILATDLLSVIDPITRARKEVPYGNVGVGITKTAGETITVSSVPMAVSLDGSGNIIASNTSSYTRSNFYGFITTTVANGATKSVLTANGSIVGGFTGLTAGTTMYVSSTGGVVSSTRGSLYSKVGYAISATEIIIDKEIEVTRLSASNATYPVTYYTSTATPAHDFVAIIYQQTQTTGGQTAIQFDGLDMLVSTPPSNGTFNPKMKIYGQAGAVVRGRQYDPNNWSKSMDIIICKQFT